VLYHLENDYRLKARHARRHEQMSQSLDAARQQQA
jgi:hypothetical protein